MIEGRRVESVIVWTPEPGIANWIVCGPALPLASRIACRSDPAPESLVLITVNVAAEAKAARTARTSAIVRMASHGSPFGHGRRRALIRNIAICPRLFGLEGQ